MFEGVIDQIDAQIAKLQQVRALLASSSVSHARRGRPAKAKDAGSAPKRSRQLSAAGRRAIAEAQRKRWATAKASKTQ